MAIPPPAEDDPAFGILRRADLGLLKVAEGIPLTEDGWTSAWQSLAAVATA